VRPESWEAAQAGEQPKAELEMQRRSHYEIIKNDHARDSGLWRFRFVRIRWFSNGGE
jgi:hypothetical protein